MNAVTMHHASARSTDAGHLRAHAASGRPSGADGGVR